MRTGAVIYSSRIESGKRQRLRKEVEVMALITGQATKAAFFHLPFQHKVEKKPSTPPGAVSDGFETAVPPPSLNKLPDNKPQALVQGDEKGRKYYGCNGCLELLALILCCGLCLEGSGRGGRVWAKKPKEPQAPAPAPAPAPAAI